MEQDKSQEGMPIAVTGGVVVVLVIVGLFLWVAHLRPAPQAAPGALTAPTSTPASTSSFIRTTSGIETWYTNDKLRFSFRLPDGFMAPEARTNLPGAQAVVVYNNSGDRLLIAAIPLTVNAANALTPGDIAAYAPGQTITNLQQGIIASLVTGFSFSTDAKEWGGDGVAFWFKYNGYLYELTTYKKDAELLSFILSTWQFAPPKPPTPK